MHEVQVSLDTISRADEPCASPKIYLDSSPVQGG